VKVSPGNLLEIMPTDLLDTLLPELRQKVVQGFR